MSFKPVVQADRSSGKWYDNALRFATHAEALAWAKDLYNRWTITTAYDAHECQDPVNSRIEDGVLYDVVPEPEPAPAAFPGCLADQLLGLTTEHARGAAEAAGASYEPNTDTYWFADGSRVKFTSAENIGGGWAAPAGFSIMGSPKSASGSTGHAVVSKDARTGFTTVRVDLNACGWNLLPDVTEEDEEGNEVCEPGWSDEVEAFARKLNDAINVAISVGCDREEIQSTALTMMYSEEGQDYGASDTDPREVLSDVLDDICAARAHLTPPEHQS